MQLIIRNTNSDTSKYSNDEIADVLHEIASCIIWESYSGLAGDWSWWIEKEDGEEIE